MRKKIYLLFFLGNLLIQASVSQTIEEAFDLHFQNSRYYGDDTWATSFSSDKTQMTEDAFYPFKIGFAHNVFLKEEGKKDSVCYFAINRYVVLPANIKKEKCTVTLNCKSDIDSLCFIVVALDKKEKKLYVDSTYIRANTQWADYSFTFSGKETQAVKMSIRYKGDIDANLEKNVYLNKISIRLGNQDINKYPISSIIQENETLLDSKNIIPLSFSDSISLAAVTSWRNKKIIALGASMYGSQEIQDAQVQFIKHLIRNENCKLLLLEVGEDVCIRWNLYLQGKIPDTFEKELIEDLKGELHNYDTALKLLRWIKHYNATTKDTIRVFGIDNIVAKNTYMADYLLKLSTSKQDSVYYLQAIAHNKYKEVKEHIRQSHISALLGEKDLAYLLFLLDEMTHISSPISEKDYKAERNVNMAMRVEQIISLFLSSTEKAIIVAHSQHVNKGVSVRDNDANHYPMGYYLQQKYKKQYYALTIQAGIGSHRQDSLYTYGKNIVEPLQAPFPFAFEQAALNTGSEYFYYVADQLPEAVLGLHLIGRPGREKKSFQYCSISSHFDALVFIRQSSASVICEEYPRGHFYWYIRGIGERFNSLKKAF